MSLAQQPDFVEPDTNRLLVRLTRLLSTTARRARPGQINTLVASTACSSPECTPVGGHPRWQLARAADDELYRDGQCLHRPQWLRLAGQEHFDRRPADGRAVLSDDGQAGAEQVSE